MEHSGVQRKSAPTLFTLERVAEILFAMLLAAGAILLLVEGTLSALSPYQLEFGEGNVLASSLRMARGESVYLPITAQPPYIFSPYGPLLYGIQAPLLRWFGTSFAPGRFLSLLATFVSAALLVLLLQRWTHSWRIALLFGMLYPSLPEVGMWAPILRADPLAVAFSLAGLYVISVTTRRWPLATMFFLAAMLVKPTLVAAPAAVFLYMLVEKQPRRALAFAATMASALLLIIFWGQHVTAGGFLSQLVGSHPESYTLKHYAAVATLVGREQFIPTLMVVAFVVVSVRRRAVTLPLLYLAMALLSTFSGGMAGASANHFLDWMAAVCVGAGMAYSFAEEGPSILARQACSVALLGMVVCALLFSTLAWLTWTEVEPGPLDQVAGLVPYAQRIFPIDTSVPQGCIELQHYLQALPGEHVVSEETGDAVLSGKTLLITDPYSYGQLVINGKLPGKPLEDMLRAHQIAAVVLAHDVPRLRADKTDRWSTSFLNAVEQDYQLDRSFECTNGKAAYLPRREPAR